MGLINVLTQQYSIKQPIMPTAAINAINSGKLPELRTDELFLQSGEKCHYIEKGILNIAKNVRVTKHRGYSDKGLFGNYRANYGVGVSENIKENYQYKGILFITNKRVIFKADENGFEKKLSSLSCINTYQDGMQFQFGTKSYAFLLPDGALCRDVINMIKG